MIPGSSAVPMARLAPLRRVAMSDEQLRRAHMAAALLLDYPSEGRFVRLGEIDADCAELPGAVSRRLRRFVAHALAVGQGALAEHYVQLFDMKRRCCLYLSYYLTGDTRRRGAALVGFAQAYRACGVERVGNELPDYLPMVLELSALGDTNIALRLLASHREGIEVLRQALTELGSPYADVVTAVAASLPSMSRQARERFRRLVVAGPPAEWVGAARPDPLEPRGAEGASP